MEILFYETARGDKPIEELLDSIDSTTRKKAIRLLTSLEQNGKNLKEPHAKKIGKRLYELRVQGTIALRILYIFEKGKPYVVHAFIKKTQKIPQNEILIASLRIPM